MTFQASLAAKAGDKTVYDGKFGLLTKAALNKALNILGDNADELEDDIDPNEQDDDDIEEDGFLDAESNELLSGSDDKDKDALHSYTITIAVRHIPQNGTRFVQDEDTGTTDMSYAEFLAVVARLIGCPITHLTDLRYVTSIMPKTKSVPKRLRTVANFVSMMSTITAYLEAKGKKGKGKKTQDMVTITVEDMSAPEPGKKVAASAKTKGGSTTVSAAAAVALPEAAGAEKEIEELMSKILAAHACATNSLACCIINTDPGHKGEHIHFKNSKIIEWAKQA
ncbi:hypothetical protein CYLTODRAFT_460744, partial [Cylindrobasidium torrendii FP15055 ss-10]